MLGPIIRALRNRDVQCVAFILAFFSVQYRTVVWQGRHWLHADNASQLFPWHYFVQNHAWRGGLTEACQGMSLGFPLFAEPQSQCFYPFNTALWPIGDPFVSFTVKLLLHMVAATLGVYVLARQEGRSALAATGAAVIMCGGAYMANSVAHFPIVMGAAWMPWIILLYLRALRTGSKAAFVGMGLCVGMQVLACHPQPSVFTLLTCLILSPFNMPTTSEGGGRRWLRPLGLLAGAWGIGLLIAMVQIAPTYEVYLYSIRTDTSPAFVRMWGANLRELGVDFLGGLPIDLKDEKTAFAGSIAWVAILWCICFVKEKRVRGWLLVAFVGLFAAWAVGNPLYDVIAHVPGLNHLRGPSRIGLLLTVGAAMLFARFLDGLASEHRRRLILVAVGGLVLLEAVAVAVTGHLGLGPALPADPLGWQLVVLLGFLAAVALVPRKTASVRWLVVLTLVIAAVEMHLFTFNVIPNYTKQEWLATPDQRIYEVAARYAATDGTAFVRWHDGLPDNMSIYYGVRQPRGYTALASREMELLNTWFYGPNPPSLLAAFGTGWVAAPRELGLKAGLKPLEQVGPWCLFRNPLPVADAYMPERLIPGNLIQAAELLRSRQAEPTREVVLPPAVMGDQTLVCPGATATVESQTNTQMVVRTRAPAPGAVIVTRQWTPHWSATVDGQPAPCFAANLILLATAVPAGEHTVRFDYAVDLRPPGLVSLLTVLGCLAWLCVEIRRSRRTLHP
jgi:hypothetical protein